MTGISTMKVTELRGKLVDITGAIWREANADTRGHVWDWVHPDAPKAHEIDGVQITWLPGAGHVAVYSEDKELMFMQKLGDLDKRLKFAVGYAQMAGGLVTEYPELDNVPNLDSCTMAVNGIALTEDVDPAFYGSEDGVGWWHDGQFVCEYDSGKLAFIVWANGSYWVSGTPQGYVESLAQAKIDLEIMEFNRLKREVA
jgi:hypothetical protein